MAVQRELRGSYWHTPEKRVRRGGGGRNYANAPAISVLSNHHDIPQLTIYNSQPGPLFASNMSAGGEMNGRIPGLQGLPTEILHLILASLPSWETKDLSLVNRRLREVCLPFLFHQVGFSFSEVGLDELQQLTNSPVRRHVKSLTYTVAELIKPGK